MVSSSNLTGVSQQQHRLTYTPDWGHHTSFASQHHLYAIDEDSQDKLHIHSLPGLYYMGCVTPQQMGLGPEDCICYVGYGDGDFLHMFVFNKNTLKDKRLVAYKVS